MNSTEWMTLLIAHHYPEDYDRCTVVAGFPVCRRCLFLYGPTLGVIALQYTPLAFSDAWDPLLSGLALPATLEFILERTERLQYNPARVIATSLLLSIPLGRAFVHYFADPWDPRGWGFALVFGLPAVLAALWRAWHDLRRDRTETRGAVEDDESDKPSSSS